VSKSTNYMCCICGLPIRGTQTQRMSSWLEEGEYWYRHGQCDRYFEDIIDAVELWNTPPMGAKPLLTAEQVADLAGEIRGAVFRR